MITLYMREIEIYVTLQLNGRCRIVDVKSLYLRNIYHFAHSMKVAA